jgi:hypothetical protein
VIEAATLLLALALLAFFFASEFVLELRPLVPPRRGAGALRAWPGAVGAPAHRARPAPPPLRRSRAELDEETPGPEAATAVEADPEAAARAGRVLDEVCAALRVARPSVCPLVPETAALRPRLAPVRPGAGNVTLRHVATLGTILTCCCADGGRGVFTRRTLAPAGLVIEDGALVSLRDRRLIEPVVDDRAELSGVYDVGPDMPYRLTAAAVATLPGRFRAAMAHLGRLPG